MGGRTVMALKYIEGFDDGLFVQKGWQGTFSPTVYPAIQTGRFGGGAMRAAYVDGGIGFFPSPLSGTLVLGFAVLPSTNAYSATMVNFGLARLKILAGGGLALHRSDNDTQIAVSSSIIWPTGNVWRYLEIKYTTSTGACEVRVDGVSVLTGTLPTTSTVSSVSYPNQPNGQCQFLIDDIYVVDTTGSRNNDYLGDVRVNTLLPTADGTYQDMTPSTGTAHYSLVNEVSPNTTNYVSSAIAGTKDSYQFADLGSGTGGVFGLRVTSYAHKDSTGTAGLRNIARVNGADYDGANIAPLSVSWTATSEMWENNPATGAQWEASDINSAEFGVKTT